MENERRWIETLERNLHHSEVGFFAPSESIDALSGAPNAYMIWTLFMMPREKGWVFRRDQLRTMIGISKRKWDEATAKLYSLGLLNSRITVDPKTGKITGRIFQVFSWAGRFDPTAVKRGETIKVKHEKLNDSNPKTVSPKNRVAVNETIYLPVGGCKGGKGKSETQKEEENCVEIKQRQEMRDRFLSRFTGKHTFQTFDDAPKKEKKLSRILFRKNYELDDLNDSGAGIFFTVNECDGKGRKKENVKTVRAVFVDLDGSPVEPVLAYNPHVVVESSPGKYHAYWLVDNFPIGAFTDTQKNLARIFAGDKAVNDLSRVMRVPGYYHRKSGRFLTKTIVESHHRHLTYSDVVSLFPPPKKEKFTAKKYQKDTPTDTEWRGQWGTSEGERNNGLAKFCGCLIKMNVGDQEFEDNAFKWGKSCSPPMPDQEIMSVIRSVGRYR
jgi:hypothetical protein